MPSHDNGETLSNVNITPNIVKNKLEQLDPNKCPGPDRWHLYFLRELSETLCIPLSILYIKSLDTNRQFSIEVVYFLVLIVYRS